MKSRHYGPYGSAAWVSSSSMSFELPLMLEFLNLKSTQVPHCRYILLRSEPTSLQHLFPTLRIHPKYEVRICSLCGGNAERSLCPHHHEQGQQQRSRSGNIHAKRRLGILNLWKRSDLVLILSTASIRCHFELDRL
jgi:hypothetical protein